MAKKKTLAPRATEPENKTPVMETTQEYLPEPPDDQAIWVYCKLTSGFIIRTPEGCVKLRGGKESRLLDANGKPMYGETKVTEDAWNYIAEIYGSLPMFHTSPPIIFAASTRDEGLQLCAEYNSAVMTGLEQLDMEKEMAEQRKKEEMERARA